MYCAKETGGRSIYSRDSTVLRLSQVWLIPFISPISRHGCSTAAFMPAFCGFCRPRCSVTGADFQRSVSLATSSVSTRCYVSRIFIRPMEQLLVVCVYYVAFWVRLAAARLLLGWFSCRLP